MSVTTATKAPPPPFSARARRWAELNLFGGVGNTLLTVITSLFLAFVTYQILRFVLFTAEWDVIEANRRLLFIGRFPQGEEWRFWPSILLTSALIGLTWGLWSKLGWLAAAILTLGITFVFIFFAHGTVAIFTALAVLLAAAGYALARRFFTRSRFRERYQQVTVAGWIVVFPLTIFMLLAFGGVDPTLWGGFYLNILLAVVGIVASFPLGVLLALGRTSSYPAIRLVSTAYIELVRGIPLVVILFMSWLVLPVFLPSWSSPVIAPDGLVRIELVYRVMIALTLFSAAYVAEIVRGGLQAVPIGQIEAAKALGLSTVRINAFIVLPQALRAVIPALVGQFISLFKDTSLVSVITLIELLRAGRAIAQGQIQFSGREAEVLLFVGLLFWIVAFSMSRLSQRLEQSLGVGER